MYICNLSTRELEAGGLLLVQSQPVSKLLPHKPRETKKEKERRRRDGNVRGKKRTKTNEGNALNKAEPES